MPLLAIKDIFSYSERNRKYASSLDILTQISNHDHVIIVENQKGFRFPTTMDKLIEIDQSTLNRAIKLKSEIETLKERDSTPHNRRKLTQLETELSQILNNNRND